MPFVLKTLIKYLLVPIGIIHAALLRTKDKIIILMYHRVDDSVKKELAVSKSDFNWHMDYLYRKGYSVITMDEAYSMISNKVIKGRHVVITFDDGYKDYYTNAYPILKKYNFPSFMYLCPGYIGTNRRYWWDNDEEVQLMEWEDISKLNAEGLVDFGSHTINHADMDQLTKWELEREIIESKEIIEKELGRPIKHFSYPRGIYSSVGEGILKQYYDTGVLISNGEMIDRRCSIRHAYVLKRIPILKSDGRYLFVARVKGWLVTEELIRKCLFRLKVKSRKEYTDITNAEGEKYDNGVPVSVIIPCYMCQDTIERAVYSVWNQTWRPKEVILVEDCSADDGATKDILHSI